MITFALVMLVITVAGLVGAHFLRTPFGVALPTSLFALVIVLYLFGLANLLALGFVLALVLIAGLAVTALVRIGPLTALRSAATALSPALVVFVLFAAITFAMTRYLQLASWDEFTHWGAVVKATLSYDAISPYNPVDLTFRSYPPGLTLFEYFITKFGRGWNESNLLWSYQLLFGTFFLPFFARMGWRSWPRLLVIVPVMALTPIVFFNSFQGTLVDPLLGLLFGYALALVYTGDTRRRLLTVQVSLAVAMLILTKDSGLFFSVIVIALLLVRVVREHRPFTTRRGILDAASVVVIPVVSAAAAYFSWKIILAALDIRVTFSEPIDPGELPGLLDGTGRPYWDEVMSAFGGALTGLPLTSANGIPISHLLWLVIAVIALVALEFAREKRWGARRDFSATIIAAVGAAVYTIGLLVLYLFRFTSYEAVHLAAYQRYLGTYWVGVISFVSFCAIALAADTVIGLGPRAETLRSRRWLLFAIGWLLVLTVLAPVRQFGGFLLDTAHGLNRSPMSPVVATAAAVGIGEEDRVWIISEYSTGYEYWVLRYQLMPSPVNDFSWSLGPPKDSDDVWTTDLTPAEWSDALEEFDYVLIQKSSAAFVETYSELFDDPSQVDDNSIFRVNESGNEVTLERVP